MVVVRAVLVQEADLLVEERAVLVPAGELAAECSLNCVGLAALPDVAHALTHVVAAGQPDLAPHAGERVRKDEAFHAGGLPERVAETGDSAHGLGHEERLLDAEVVKEGREVVHKR